MFSIKFHWQVFPAKSHRIVVQLDCATLLQDVAIAPQVKHGVAVGIGVAVGGGVNVGVEVGVGVAVSIVIVVVVVVVVVEVGEGNCV